MMATGGGQESAALRRIDFLAAIIEHVAHPIFVKDRQHRFVLVNRALCEMVGFGREEMVGKTDYDFFPQEQAEFFRQKDLEMFASGSTVTIEEEPITDADGELHLLETVKVPYRDSSGEVTHLVGIINDITAVKRAEEALRRANEELEERVRERTGELRRAQERLLRKERLAVLGQLSGGVAHQLRNPLGIIQNAVSLLRHAQLDAAGADALAIIAEEVHRADQTIRDLLDYARVRPPQRRVVDLLPVLEDALEQARIPATIVLRVEVPAVLRVDADPLQLQNAVGNVLRNAVEAMPDGGVLTVCARAAGETVHVLVSDTGVGVPPEARERLFEPLVSTKLLGIGLGLSTSRTLIEAQGGQIEYQPVADGGSQFVIELRAAVAAAGAGASASA